MIRNFLSVLKTRFARNSIHLRSCCVASRGRSSVPRAGAFHDLELMA
jgi:hypothetical protein